MDRMSGTSAGYPAKFRIQCQRPLRQQLQAMCGVVLLSDVCQQLSVAIQAVCRYYIQRYYIHGHLAVCLTTVFFLVMYHLSVRNSSCLSKLQLYTVHPAGSCHHNIHCQVFTYHRMKLSAERLPPLLLFTPQVSIIPFCSVILDAHMYTLRTHRRQLTGVGCGLLPGSAARWPRPPYQCHLPIRKETPLSPPFFFLPSRLSRLIRFRSSALKIELILGPLNQSWV